MPSLLTERRKYQPKISEALKKLDICNFKNNTLTTIDSKIKEKFPRLSEQPQLSFITCSSDKGAVQRIAVVLSGGQAAGGHNVIAAIFDAIKVMNPASELIGFLGGPIGIIKGDYKVISEEIINQFRNTGGFDMIGSGREKIETDEQFSKALKIANELSLTGIIIIGGDDSNTNASHLAEYFLKNSSNTVVVGVPKTIDGDLQSECIEIPFGFDTACKVYSETIGNIAIDALSNKKYYYFIKLMGRSASHITLECALQTQPNLAFIGEEIDEFNYTIKDVVNDIVKLVCERKLEKKEYGMILIPEGLIEFLHDVKELISALNSLLTGASTHIQKLEALKVEAKIEYIASFLQDSAKATFLMLPESTQLQLMLDRDPHGNVQVSKIETDKLLSVLVERELKELSKKGLYKGKFSAQPIFCGYEGRSAFPSNFDANYCYNLGLVAALLVIRKKTGFMAALTGLSQDTLKWQPQPAAIIEMLHYEIRSGIEKAVIQKTVVDLQGKPFLLFSKLRQSWRGTDCYKQIGPMQFFGPKELTDSITITVQLSKDNDT